MALEDGCHRLRNDIAKVTAKFLQSFAHVQDVIVRLDSPDIFSSLPPGDLGAQAKSPSARSRHRRCASRSSDGVLLERAAFASVFQGAKNAINPVIELSEDNGTIHMKAAKAPSTGPVSTTAWGKARPQMKDSSQDGLVDLDDLNPGNTSAITEEDRAKYR